jgi:glycerol-3-phosphate acyltransferase PlsX
MVKEKKGDVFLSAGNTGALMAGGLFILGRIKGVDRPALASYLPSKKGMVLLVDAGANTNCKPMNYQQFGIMGSIFISEVFNKKNPRVGLLNVGVEEKKGNETIRNAYTLLKESNINFTGNIEGRQILEGDADVIVTDGFVGNVVLKFLEGAQSYFFKSLKEIFYKNIISKIAASVMKKDMSKFKKSLDYTEYGGVPLLGVKGKVIKGHEAQMQKL